MNRGSITRRQLPGGGRRVTFQSGVNIGPNGRVTRGRTVPE